MASIAFFKLLFCLTTCVTVQATTRNSLLDVDRQDSQEVPASCNYQNYAALGDSYSAGLYSQPRGELPICNGHNGPNCTTKLCARNVGAYGYLFANEAPKVSNFQFLACSGADTTSCQQDQVPSINSNSDLVTFTIGGNNNNSFATVVKYCVYEHFWRQCASALHNATMSLPNLKQSLPALYQKIRQQSGKAKIVHLGYPAFWPAIDVPSQCQDDFLRQPNATEKAYMNQLTRWMNGNISLIAASSTFDVSFVDVDAGFEGHRLCDTGRGADCWFRYALFGFDRNEWNYENGVFHPTYGGQNEYHSQLMGALGCPAAQGQKVRYDL